MLLWQLQNNKTFLSDRFVFVKGDLTHAPANFPIHSRLLLWNHHRRRCSWPAYRSFHRSPLCRYHSYRKTYIVIWRYYASLALYVVIFFFLYGWHIPGGTFTLLLYGLFSGIFLGGWIMALAEMADVFPIFSRRIKLTNGIRWVVIAVALRKMLWVSLILFL